MYMYNMLLPVGTMFICAQYTLEECTLDFRSYIKSVSLSLSTWKTELTICDYARPRQYTVTGSQASYNATMGAVYSDAQT